MSKTDNIKLTVIEPREHPERNKNFMIVFTADDKNICMAFNWAIESILKREGLSPYHHTEKELVKQHEPGYHEWEIREESSKKHLGKLVSEMEERAKETADIFDHFGAETE